MKIRYLSDLHLELHPAPKLGHVGEDIVVLAGDIDCGTGGIEWAKRAFRSLPVIYVLGNHEFHGCDYYPLIDATRATAASSNVHLLENSAYDFMGFRFIGCTLWTDFLALGPEQCDEAMQLAEDSMSDYALIRTGGVQIWPEFTSDRCRESRSWLRSELRAAGPPVIAVTHHSPVMETVNPRFVDDISNASFHNEWPELFASPLQLWIHGHNHWSGRKYVNGIPVVANQRGYPTGGVAGFRWDQTIEVTL